MIRTKLVATAGPACVDDEVIGAMIESGVDVFRLNFSHGTLEGHGAALEAIRRVAGERGATVAVLGDLSGPKIRVGRIAAGSITLEHGQYVTFQRAPVEGTAERLSTTWPTFVDDVRAGHRILIDDGNILLRAVETPGSSGRDEVVAVCEIGGVVSDHKGINLPDTTISSPAITDKDLDDLDWAIDSELDYVALSFVRHPDDMRALRDMLKQRGSNIRTISKIEKPEALTHLDEIIAESDVVLVARGDLGVEMDVSRVPIVQKEIVLKCQQAGKPVIVATQMLQSMVDAPLPTRAEVSDVANAILDQADAVMLSAETAIGRYPVQAVRMTQKIAAETESFGNRYGERLAGANDDLLRVAGATVRAAGQAAADLAAVLLAVWTESGDSARLLSKHRPAKPIVALSPHERVCRQMAMLYGVMPVRMDRQPDFEHLLAELDRMLLARELAAINDQIVVVYGTRLSEPGETNTLFIHRIGGD